MKRPRIYSALINPPLLVSESRDEFDSIRSAIIAHIKPTDFIEKLYVSELTSYAWDVLRLRRVKAATINSAFQYALMSILVGLLPHADEWGYEIPDTAQELATKWFSDERARKLVLELLKKVGLNESAIESKAIANSTRDLVVLDQMLASAEARRDKALRFVAEYRSEFASLLRQATGRVIEGEAVVIDEGVAQARARHVQ